MVHETTTSLPGADVLARAKRFFAERVPHNAAFPEQEGPTHVVLRGQGGEDQEGEPGASVHGEVCSRENEGRRQRTAVTDGRASRATMPQS